MSTTRIKQIYDAMNLTQGEFANLLKVSKRIVNYWLRGEYNPSPLATLQLKRIEKRLQKKGVLKAVEEAEEKQ